MPPFALHRTRGLFPMQETQDRSIEQLRILEKGGMADSRQVYELCTRDGFGHFNVMLGADRFVILSVAIATLDPYRCLA